MNILRKLKRARKGLAMAMVALMLPVFGIIMVFAIDLGLAQTAQSRLEQAVNRAVDASVIRLPDTVGATDLATSMVRLSLADHERFGDNLQVSVSIDGFDITVTATMTARAYFGGLADQNNYNIAAEASRTLLP